MKVNRSPYLIGVTVVLFCSAVSSIYVQNDYVATDLDDPLQAVWDTLDSLPDKVSEAVTSAIRTKLAQMNTQMESKFQSLKTSLQSVKQSVRRLELTSMIGRGVTTDSTLTNVRQFYQTRVLRDLTETTTKIEHHVDAQVAALKEYMDSKLLTVAAAVREEDRTRGNTETDNSGHVTQTLTANSATLQNIIDHILKINEKLGESSESGESCGTLVDKVSEMMSSSGGGGGGGGGGETGGGSGVCDNMNQRTLMSLVLPRDCSDKHWQEPAGPSGVYEIYPTLDPKDPVTAYCDMGQPLAKDSGGWTVILRRRNTTFGLENFNRSWSDYRVGFGNPAEGEWWFGLSHIHALTYRQPFEVDLLLHDIELGTYHVQYTTFRVEDEAHKYRLLLGGFSGNVTHDALTAKHNGSPFTTWDKDNDAWKVGNCAQSNGGGWWFDACHFTTLTAPFPTSADREARTIRWLEEDWLVFDDVTMKIRPFNYAQRFNTHKTE